MNRLTVSVPGPVRRAFEGLRHRFGGRGIEQVPTRVPWEAGSAVRASVAPKAPAARLVTRLVDGSRKIVAEFAARPRTSELVAATRRRYALPGVALGLSAGLQWNRSGEVEAWQNFDEIGKNLQEIFRAGKAEACPAYDIEDDSFAGLALIIEEGTSVDAIEEQESEDASISDDSDFIVLKEGESDDSSIQEFVDDMDLTAVDQVDSLIAEQTPLSVGLRELLELAEHQAVELCSLREAEARTSLVLADLIDCVVGDLQPEELCIAQWVLLQRAEEQHEEACEQWGGDGIEGLVERQRRELDRLGDKVTWQNRVIKQLMGKMQVQPTNATPQPFCKRDAVYLGRENPTSFEFMG